MTSEDLDRVQLAEVARQVLAHEAGPDRLRAAVDQGGNDPDLRRVLSELGWYAILVPEEYGGFSGRAGDVFPLLVEMGRRAAVGPFGASAVVATRALMVGSAAVQQEFLPAMATGESLATVALLSSVGSMPMSSSHVTASRSGSGWRLDGSSTFVPFGRDADVVVVLAASNDAPRGFVLKRDEVTRCEPLHTWDATRRFDTIDLEGVEFGPERELALSGPELVDDLGALAAYWLACDSLGMSQQLVEATSAYGTERVQFNRPIGSFQAWKHYAADMHIASEAARAGAERAARALDRGADVVQATSVAKLVAGDAAESVASWATQLHGGIAYTWEHDTHFYLKRAKLNQLLFGDGDYHCDRIAGVLEG